MCHGFRPPRLGAPVSGVVSTPHAVDALLCLLCRFCSSAAVARSPPVPYLFRACAPASIRCLSIIPCCSKGSLFVKTNTGKTRKNNKQHTRCIQPLLPVAAAAATAAAATAAAAAAAAAGSSDGNGSNQLSKSSPHQLYSDESYTVMSRSRYLSPRGSNTSASSTLVSAAGSTAGSANDKPASQFYGEVSKGG